MIYNTGGPTLPEAGLAMPGLHTVQPCARGSGQQRRLCACRGPSLPQGEGGEGEREGEVITEAIINRFSFTNLILGPVQYLD